MGKSEEDQSICGASPVALMERNLPAMGKMRAQSLGLEDPLEKGMATHINIHAWQIPRTSWVWYCIITFQIVPVGENCSRVHRTSLYYFLHPYVNLQLTQKKKFNLKIFTSSIFTDNILLNVVLKRTHSSQHIFLMNESIQVKNSYKSTFLCPQPPAILHSQSRSPTSRWQIQHSLWINVPLVKLHTFIKIVNSISLMLSNMPFNHSWLCLIMNN